MVRLSELYSMLEWSLEVSDSDAILYHFKYFFFLLLFSSFLVFFFGFLTFLITANGWRKVFCRSNEEFNSVACYKSLLSILTELYGDHSN